MQNTIALLSSSRKHGNTHQLLEAVAQHWPMKIVFLDDFDIGDYHYEYKNHHDQFHSLMDQVLEYDNIIFASPIYWDSVTPKLKAFLDRISDFLDLEDLRDKGRALRNKNTWVICTSIQPRVSRVFLSMFKEVFSYLGLSFNGYLHVNCSDGFDVQLSQKQIHAFARAKASYWAELAHILRSTQMNK